MNKGCLWLLLGWLFGASIKNLPRSQRKVARRAWHTFRFFTAKRRSSKLYHLFRLFD
ncbi:MAG: hypothetical protein SQA66_16405 [Candidatus Fervidibacter sacchari]